MKQQLEVRLSQKMVMTPQLQQAIHLLMLNRLDLAQEMQEIVLENPVLEIEEESPEPEEWSTEGADGETLHSMGEDTRPDTHAPEDEDRVPDPMSNWEYSVDENLDEESFHREERTLRESDSGEFSFEKVLAAPTTLADHLEWQLSFTDLSPAERSLATYLIGNLDEDGYLHLDVTEIPEGLLKGVSLPRVIETIQGFDPPGVGARSLQECLMIQVRHLGQDKELPGRILSDYFQEFLEMGTKAIARGLKVPVEEVSEAVTFIRSLEPKPGRPYYRESPSIVVPDLRFYEDDEGVLRVVMNEQGLPRLRIQPAYRAMLKAAPKKDELRDYLEEKMRAAQWFLKSVDQRRRTILRVGESILRHQEEFFRRGPTALRPLVLRTIAQELGLHESTISRVTNQKYAETPFGVVELKYFFSGGVPSSSGGDEHSAVSVREKIRQLVKAESPEDPLTDQEIVDKLSGSGIVIARRTVAKYRTELDIPSVSQRRRGPWDQRTQKI
ncbi:MAG: RNA polymerase factor sigma-54 [Nitrospiraceae bacterium]|jgi:RNA polymerase sigma-54 factor|nr:RNA polymerase factor sigma-54 [Nitrospiraceae bacterium]